MSRAVVGVIAALGLAATVAAEAPGFTNDLTKAKAEALATGKLVFIYFSLPG